MNSSRKKNKSSSGFKLGGPSIYERCQMAKKEKERKIRKLRQSIERDYTFTPNTAKSKATSPSTVSTMASTPSPKGNKDYSAVFDRLYGDAKRADDSSSFQTRCKSRSSWVSNTSSTTSARIEALYQQGRQRFRNRPANDLQERYIRELRLAKEQEAECTFKPRTYWGKQKTVQGKPPRRLLEPRMILLPTKKVPPKEIKIPLNLLRPWNSPLRTTRISLLRSISPLPIPDLDDDGETLSQAATIVSKANQTEYGSI